MQPLTSDLSEHEERKNCSACSQTDMFRTVGTQVLKCRREDLLNALFIPHSLLTSYSHTFWTVAHIQIHSLIKRWTGKEKKNARVALLSLGHLWHRSTALTTHTHTLEQCPDF